MDKCKDVARMISDSMDRPLTLGERLRLKVHLAICRGCSNFEKQMMALRDMARRFGQKGEERED